MMASYVWLQMASHPVQGEAPEAALGFMLVIRKDFSMKPGLGVSTNLEGKRSYLPSSEI